jgi:glucose/arabinose dehydrogenase
MLGMAFHPEFASNGLVFVSYTATDGDVVVARYRAAPGAPDRADPGSARTVIRIDHPGLTHNGGQLAFGADGMLYVSVGDGGSGGDLEGDAQSLRSLLGKILRLDVDARDPYAIPAGNPFAGRPGARPEIWALGLRNPWRFSFDPETDRLIVADVGQNAWEEVNVVPSRVGGFNFGWNVVEGTHCFGGTPCDAAALTPPTLEYEHAPPCTSVIGGYVYRGARLPAHAGRYFFADYCLGWIRSIRLDASGIDEYVEWTDPPPGRVQSFGLDGAGELYLLLAGGSIYRLGAEQ